MINEWIYLNDNPKSKKGIEAKFKSTSYGQVLFVISGTNCFWDWVTNFCNFWRKGDSEGRQFFSQYLKEAIWLEEKIKNLRALDGETFIFMGFSRGGGIAEIMTRSCFNCSKFLTMSGPKVCANKKAKKSSSENGIKIFNVWDMVPRVPMWFFNTCFTIVEKTKYLNPVKAHEAIDHEYYEELILTNENWMEDIKVVKVEG